MPMNKLELRVGEVDLVEWIRKQKGEDLVDMLPLCESLGLDPVMEQEEISSNPLYKCSTVTVVEPLGNGRSALCIPVRQVSGWLYSLDSSRVRSEVAPQLRNFQEGLSSVVQRHMQTAAQNLVG